MFKYLVSLLLILQLHQTNAFMMPMIMQQQASDRRQFLGKVSAAAGISFLAPKLTPALTPDEINQIKLYDTTIPSVCYIITDYNVTQPANKFGNSRPHGIGSGFVYDNDGHIVTNFHVINKCINATVKFMDSEGTVTEYIPRLTGYDQDKDIAVLKIDRAPALKPIPLSTNKDVKIGMNCFALGNPFGKPFSFTMGMISGKGRDITSPSGRKMNNIIQADVPINKGNSGGPLIDSSGRLVGVNTAIFGGDVSTGISLSIAVDDVKETVNNILKNGIIDNPTLGIEYLTAVPTKTEAFQSGLTFVESGIVILKVFEGSAAFKAGLQGLSKKDNQGVLGDVIIAVDNIPVKTPDEMLKVLDTKKPMQKTKLKILRGNELTEMEIDVTLGSSDDNQIGLQLEH
jgi:S1-C subfamily serine protease